MVSPRHGRSATGHADSGTSNRGTFGNSERPGQTRSAWGDHSDQAEGAELGAGPAVEATTSIGLPLDSEKQAYKLLQTLQLDAEAQNAGARAVSAAAGFQSTDHMIEEALNMGSGDRFWRAVKKTIGILAITEAARKEHRRRRSADYEPAFPCLAAIVNNPCFEGVMGLIMIANALLVGVEASIDQESDEVTQLVFELCEHIFTAIFVFEIIGRVLVCGWIWLLDLLNALDFLLITFTGVLPMWILRPAGVKSDLVRVLQVLRILRFVRLIRMFRTVRFLRTGYKLATGLFNSGTIIFHTYAMMGAGIYIFAVFSVYLIGRSKDLDDSISDHREVREMFRTVPAAMFTLFEFITLNDWTDVVRPTREYTNMVLGIGVIVIMVMTLVLTNLITAVIVTHALGQLKEDNELMAAEKRQEEQGDMRDLRRVFRETAGSSRALLEKERFMSAMNIADSDLRRKLGGMKISLYEAEEVWDLLGVQEKGIGEKDFCSAIRAMKGAALAKDSFGVAQHMKRLNSRMGRVKTRFNSAKDELETLRSETAAARKELHSAMQEVHHFFKFAGMCVPQDPVTDDPHHLKAFMDTRDNWRIDQS